jgi:integrase
MNGGGEITRDQLNASDYALAVRNKHFAASAIPYIERLTEDNARKGFIEPADFARLLTFLRDDGLRDFVQWSYACGMRHGEGDQLTWAMIANDELYIPGSICKNHEGRALPLSSELLQIINRRKLARRVKVGDTFQMVEYIFHRGGLPIGEFRKSWKSACKLANLPGIIPHDMRLFCP